MARAARGQVSGWNWPRLPQGSSQNSRCPLPPTAPHQPDGNIWSQQIRRAGIIDALTRLTGPRPGRGQVTEADLSLRAGFITPTFVPTPPSRQLLPHPAPVSSQGAPGGAGPAGKGCPAGGTSPIFGAARNSHSPADGGGWDPFPLLAHLPALFLDARFSLKKHLHLDLFCAQAWI